MCPVNTEANPQIDVCLILGQGRVTLAASVESFEIQIEVFGQRLERRITPGLGIGRQAGLEAGQFEGIGFF